MPEEPGSAKDLVCAHRYAEGAALCEERLRELPDDPYHLGWHATAMLCLGRFSEALAEHRRLDEIDRAELEGAAGCIEMIGTLLWLLGRRDEAIEVFSGGAAGILNYSIRLGDLAGGVSHGLLLWYAAVSARDEGAREEALHFLRDRAARKAAGYWPGPLARYVLGTASQEEVLLEGCGTPRLEKAVRVARDDILKRRCLVGATFCFATRCRELGAEEDCVRWMHRCAGLANPIVEEEWYLARQEAERSPLPASDRESASSEPGGWRRVFAWFR